MSGSETGMITAFYDALLRGDMASAETLLSPSVRHVVYSDGVHAPFEGTFLGRPAVLSQLSETARSWDFEKLDILQLEIDGNRAAARVRTHARHRVEGRTLVIDGTHFFELGADGIEGFDVFFQSADGETPRDRPANEP